MDANDLAQRFALHPITAQILLERGYTTIDSVTNFLEGGQPNPPYMLPGLQEAAEHLFRRPGRVWIHGDYDVDGVSGSAILYLAFKLVGIEARIHIPHRVRDGYGLSARAIKQSLKDGCDTLITVDCGTSCPDEVALARAGGACVILTDHHEPRGDGTLPDPNFLIHPLLRPGYPYPYLCGAALAWKLATHTLALYKKLHQPDLLALAALGTVADVMPLDGENRDLVRAGLRRLATTTSAGLRALLAVCKAPALPDAGSLGFQLAPRLNACGRLDDARLAFELLTTTSSNRATELALLADSLNQQRRVIEKNIRRQVTEFQKANPAYVLAHSKDWHPGVVGVVAGKVSDELGVPSFVAHGPDANGIVSGSARSGPNERGVKAILQDCSDLLLRSGGHQAAAGFSLHESNLPAFRERLTSVIGSIRHVPAEPPSMKLALPWVTLDLAEDILRLEPFGRGNPAPLFRATVSLATPPRQIGSDGSHLAVDLYDPAHSGSQRRAVAFGMGDRLTEMAFGGKLRILYWVRVNEFRGVRTAEIQLKDFQREG